MWRTNSATRVANRPPALNPDAHWRAFAHQCTPVALAVNEPSRKTVTFEDVERRLVGEHRKPCYDWLRHVVTLALAALTALVALQGHYVPQKPVAPFLLAVGWAALAITIVSGLFALRSEYTTPLLAARRIREMRAQHGDQFAATSLEKNSGTLPNSMHKWSVRAMVGSFLVALASICAFAIANLPWK
jgi:hypothetical protein